MFYTPNSKLRKLQLYQLEIFKKVDKICQNNNIKYYMIAGTLLGAVRHKGFIPWDDDIDIAMFRSDYDRFIECCKKDLTDKYFLQNYRTDIDYFPALTRICMNNTFAELASSIHLRHHKGIFIDIFPLDNVPDNKKEWEQEKKLLAFIDKIKVIKACYIYEPGILYWKFIIKRLLKLLLIFIPIKWLQGIREKIVTANSADDTKFVCSTASKYGFDKQTIERKIYGEPVLLEFEGGLYSAPQKWDEYLTRLYGDYMTLPPVEKRLNIDVEYIKIIFDCELEQNE